MEGGREREGGRGRGVRKEGRRERAGGGDEGGREVRSKLPPYPTEVFMSMSSSP